MPPGAEDCGGDYLAPGLIELHTDNLERHLEPRPGVRWPEAPAILAHDAELAGTGITTVFDALRVGSLVDGGKAGFAAYARPLATAIRRLRDAGALRIRHLPAPARRDLLRDPRATSSPPSPPRTASASSA